MNISGFIIINYTGYIENNMVMNMKKLTKINSSGLKIILCIFVNIITKTILTLLSAVIISKYGFNEDNITIFPFIICIISGLIGGFCAGKTFRSKGFLWGGITGLAGALMLISLIAVLNHFSLSLLLLIILPVELITGAIGGIISSNLRN